MGAGIRSWRSRSSRREDDPSFKAAWLDIAASPRPGAATKPWPSCRAKSLAGALGRPCRRAAFAQCGVETGTVKTVGPVPLDWNDLAQAKMNLVLSRTDAILLERVIEDATPIRAIGEIEVEGVSERLPLAVTVGLRALVAAPLQAADAEATMSRDELERRLAERDRRDRPWRSREKSRAASSPGPAAPTPARPWPCAAGTRRPARSRCSCRRSTRSRRAMPSPSGLRQELRDLPGEVRQRDQLPRFPARPRGPTRC